MPKAKEVKIKIRSESAKKNTSEIQTKTEAISESSDKILTGTVEWKIKNPNSGFKATDLLALVVILGGAYYAFIKHDYILLMLALALGFSFLLASLRSKNQIIVKLQEGGIIIDKDYYPWEQFKKFEIKESEEKMWLGLEPKSKFLLPIWLTIDDKNKIDNIKKIIADKLKEEPITSWLENWLKPHF